MSAARRLSPDERREQLTAAALETFKVKGVEATTVSDIVRAAGVAQGTFYLYFETKADVVNAVVDLMVEGVVERVRAALDAPDESAYEKLLVLRDALLETSDEPHEREMMAIYHAPENREVHDRMGRRVAEELAPLLTRIVECGVERGEFTAEDPRLSALFILGSFSALENAGLTQLERFDTSLSALTAFVLRGLGWRGEAPGG